MDQKLEELNALLSLFDAKEAEKGNINREIAIALSPTLLSAIFELVSLPTEAVGWRDFTIANNCLIVDVVLTYDPSKVQSQYLKLITNQSDQSEPMMVQRVVQLGLPLALLFNPKEEIKSLLYDMAKQDVPAIESKQDTNGRFDFSMLSDDQVRAILTHRIINKETKQ